jgi:two-component system chemotaxis sensor kinase CheA
MAIDLNDEILQDFLVEASEILELLGEQLVGLEQTPEDQDLLNAVFRGFHTVKGGAGFLGLSPLVEVCHRAEDVFNLLRQGERQANPQLMDVILKVTDVVNAMMEQIRSGEDPEEAEPELLQALEVILKGEEVPAAAPAEEAPAEADAEQVPEAGSDVESESKAAVESGSDEITEDEFEALLDQLHGSAAAADTTPEAEKSAAPAAATTSSSDEISEDEFEALLDELDARKKGQPPAETKKPTAAKTEPKGAAKPAAAEPARAETQKSAKEAQSVEATVRVDTRRLDDIMNLVGELVLVRNRMSTLKTTMANEEVSKAIANLDLVTADLQTSVMKTRMQPIKKVFGRFPRVVRDLARSLKKEVNLELFGEETDLDKNLVEALADPLVHLVRNAVDHGIEMPDEREKVDKPRAGTVVLSAQQEGDHILLIIEDDGKGMDADVLRAKAVEKGIMDEDTAARLDEKACYNLIFAPGFSTKSEISDVSGRGVGMDVVKTRIAQLNGTVEIDSELGKGSRINIKLPLTLAIMPTLMVVLGGQVFALPLANVSEIFDMESAKLSTIDGKEVVIIREKAVPLVRLHRWLVHERCAANSIPDNEGYVVVTTIGNQHVGCVVDQLVGQEEVVIKPLGALLHGTKGVSGATITGNGGIALILDMPGLMEKYAGTLSR